jgi:Domain of unknown function (DUF4159)
VKSRIVRLLLATVLLCAVAGLVMAQRGRSRGYGGRGFRGQPLDGSYPSRMGVPEWENDPEFKKDVFTFARIIYRSAYWGGGGGRERWATDAPASDLNFSFRLQQLTSMKVNPEVKCFTLTDPQLFEYPFIYIVEPGALFFDDAEVKALRRYLLNGGFLMVDDFWGEDEWYNFESEFRKVFPKRELVELPLSHPIFHCVYDLKIKPQIPAIGHGIGGRGDGRTWERPDAQTPHYKGVFDDDGRMMAIICHNTDLGDGWEREGEDPWYFKEFSEKYAYPLGINIVVYAMTH